MAKNLIIGAFTNYTYNQLKPWVESIDECGFEGDKVMVVGNASQETRDELIKRNFKIVDMLKVEAPIHVARFLAIYDYLKDTWKDYDYVVTTDVKDVYFQKDPIEWIKKNLPENKTLVAGSESISYKYEPWGNQNLMETYGPYFYLLFVGNEIYNVGTIGGTAEYVKDLVLNIFINSTNRPIPIVDQAVYNVSIQTQPYKDKVLFTKQQDGWAVQLGTTGDPSKIEAFRPFLTEPEPAFDFESGLVKTHTGEPFCIVHQYDRVPLWKELIMKKFNQEDPNNFFVYRV